MIYSMEYNIAVITSNLGYVDWFIQDLRSNFFRRNLTLGEQRILEQDPDKGINAHSALDLVRCHNFRLILMEAGLLPGKGNYSDINGIIDGFVDHTHLPRELSLATKLALYVLEQARKGSENTQTPFVILGGSNESDYLKDRFQSAGADKFVPLTRYPADFKDLQIYIDDIVKLAEHGRERPIHFF